MEVAPSTFRYILYGLQVKDQIDLHCVLEHLW